MSLILLEYEEDVRLASKIIARMNNIIIDVYSNYNDYKKNSKTEDIILSSNIKECEKYSLIYLEKPYTSKELIATLKEFCGE